MLDRDSGSKMKRIPRVVIMVSIRYYAYVSFMFLMEKYCVRISTLTTDSQESNSYCEIVGYGIVYIHGKTDHRKSRN